MPLFPLQFSCLTPSTGKYVMDVNRFVEGSCDVDCSASHKVLAP